MVIKSRTLIATPPGYAIKEQLKEKRFSQKEFALRMEMSEKHISKLLNGEVILTVDMALRLEMVLGVPAKFWLNLEMIYREKIAKIQLENQMDEDILIASRFPYAEMSTKKWVKETDSKIERVFELRKFFEVIRLGLLFENNPINAFYLRMDENSKEDYAFLAWVQKVKVLAREYKVSSVNIEGAIMGIATFKKMMKKPTSESIEELKIYLAKKGIVLILLPHLNENNHKNLTFCEKNRIIMALALKDANEDLFWANFLHEYGHIVLGHLQMKYDEKQEKDVIEFAKQILVS